MKFKIEGEIPDLVFEIAYRISILYLASIAWDWVKWLFN